MQKFSKENLRITKFRLNLPATDLLLPCKVDEWLQIAVRNQIAEIELQGPVNYKLPRFLFRAKSLRSLCWTNLVIPYYEAVDLVSLERLELWRVVIEERMLLHIVSSCPLLKDLSLSNCSGFKNIVIPCRSKLEDLFIEGDLPIDGKVILETSSLRSFEYIPDDDNNPWPIISNRGLLRNLRVITVYSVSITNKALAELLPELDSLEKLEIAYCDMLTSIKISNTQLKQICLEGCYRLLNVVIDAPCLKEFKYEGNIIPSLSITNSSQANCSIHICIRPSYFEVGGFCKLKKLLTGLNRCNVLRITLPINLFKVSQMS
ncbi:FBD-associated F-box protein At5g22730-like [Silene latifolia]|uniref:FBD-associated F-box protein At5g22730-like n=1 Tax=Silene latifolia TaxID=37657 RepID=UPI003D77B668